MSKRAELLAALGRAVPEPAGHPVRVAIDGMTGVGKTTLRAELAAALRDAGREVVEASGDDFHHQREHRYRQGRRSARGYYEDAYDYHAMAAKLLAPLGPGGDRCVRTRHHDLETDALLSDEPVVEVDPKATLVVDGSFLMRPEVAHLWDFVVLVETTREVSVARQSARDGSPTDPADPYYDRYLSAYDLYLAQCDPRARAQVIVENSDLEHPVLRFAG